MRVDDFPTLGLGTDAGRAGGAAPAVFNAANEQAVALFLDGHIGFGDIARAIAHALEPLGHLPAHSREALLTADAEAPRHVSALFPC